MLEHKVALLRERASHSEASQAAAAADEASAAVEAARQAAAEAEARRSQAAAAAQVRPPQPPPGQHPSSLAGCCGLGRASCRGACCSVQLLSSAPPERASGQQGALHSVAGHYVKLSRRELRSRERSVLLGVRQLAGCLCSWQGGARGLAP